MANLVFELEKKLSAQSLAGGLPAGAPAGLSVGVPAAGLPAGVRRNIDKMKAVLEEAGLLLLNPAGETYNEKRTDLEASITGSANGSLQVLDVIKPIVYSDQDGMR